MRTSSEQSLAGLLVDLAHETVNSCSRQKETHLFTKCSMLALTYRDNTKESELQKYFMTERRIYWGLSTWKSTFLIIAFWKLQSLEKKKFDFFHSISSSPSPKLYTNSQSNFIYLWLIQVSLQISLSLYCTDWALHWEVRAQSSSLVSTLF